MAGRALLCIPAFATDSFLLRPATSNPFASARSRDKLSDMTISARTCIFCICALREMLARRLSPRPIGNLLSVCRVVHRVARDRRPDRTPYAQRESGAQAHLRALVPWPAPTQIAPTIQSENASYALPCNNLRCSLRLNQRLNCWHTETARLGARAALPACVVRDGHGAIVWPRPRRY
jgi:hypothetical protein